MWNGYHTYCILKLSKKRNREKDNMKDKKMIRKTYESPEVEVTLFSFEDSIAASGNGVGLMEQIWGGGSDV